MLAVRVTGSVWLPSFPPSSLGLERICGSAALIDRVVRLGDVEEDLLMMVGEQGSIHDPTPLPSEALVG